MQQTPAPAWLPPGPIGGILCMLVGMVLLILSDAITKWLLTWYPVPEIISLRALIVIVILALWYRGRKKLRFISVYRHGMRGVFACMSSYLFVYGLGYLPLVDASAAAFAGPLFLTALAGPVLAEQVGWRRWCAVIVGFISVLIMLRPFGEGIQWAILLPVSAALCGALRDLITRRISQWESAESILFSSNIILFIVGLATLNSGWTLPMGWHLFLVVLSGLLLGAAHYLHILAFRLTEASALSPFRYSSIIWSILVGYLLWGHLPDIWMICGGSGIVFSGLYILHRERHSLVYRGTNSKVTHTRPARRPE